MDNNDTILGFHQMGLDDRLKIAIARLGWKSPTLIQEKAIPLALEGKDILARARTGSGKTGAFLIPIIEKLLRLKQDCHVQEIRALVVAPSKELCKQICTNIKELTTSCGRDIHSLDVSIQADPASQKPLLMEKPDILVGTPSRVLRHIKAGHIDLSQSLSYLVVDEADLIFGFGYEADMNELLKHLPRVFQSSLMSATLTPDVLALKKHILHNPVILKLEEPDLPSLDQLTQFHIKCEEEEKFVVICALFKLNLIRGKTILFVNTVDRCYKLKLFLEQFGIKSCILNSELPVMSRCHIVNEFNQGVYNTIIASDEKSCDEKIEPEKKEGGEINKEASKKKKRRKDYEYGISRGIDFQFVSNVFNFDFPLSVDSYIHRVGRTARNSNQGTALSFVSIKDILMMEEVEKAFVNSEGESADASIFKPYQFKMEEIEGFRYRARDAVRAVTRIAVREARLQEIKSELMKSKKLKTYFDDNPKDLVALRHDQALHTVKLGSSLKDVPDYIVPPSLKMTLKVDRRKNFFKNKKNKKPEGYHGKSKGNWKLKRKTKKGQAPNDPLKTFKIG